MTASPVKRGIPLEKPVSADFEGDDILDASTDRRGAGEFV